VCVCVCVCVCVGVWVDMDQNEKFTKFNVAVSNITKLNLNPINVCVV